MQHRKSAIGLLLGSTLGIALGAYASDTEHHFPRDTRIDHVLLVSVDGLHAIDLENYIMNTQGRLLRNLPSTGSATRGPLQSKPSDSFPGLLLIVTGGSPISTGVFYDVSYDRSLFDPSNTDCHGAPGTVTTFDETIDLFDKTGKDLDLIDPPPCRMATMATDSAFRSFPMISSRSIQFSK